MWYSTNKKKTVDLKIFTNKYHTLNLSYAHAHKIITIKVCAKLIKQQTKKDTHKSCYIMHITIEQLLYFP